MPGINFYLWLTVLLSITAIVLFFLSRREKVIKKGRTGFYQLACLSVFLWLYFTMFLFTELDRTLSYQIAMWRYIGIAFMPVFTALHIWQQFSSETIKKKVLYWCFLPPLISVLLAVTNEKTHFFIKSYTFPNPQYKYIINFDNNWGFYLHCIFSYTAVLISLYLLFRIYFRVPKHMRKTISMMVAAAAAMVLCNLFILFFGSNTTYDITAVAAVITLVLFYAALNVTRSANIIITSREHILKNISSMVIVLDENSLILDFSKENHSEWTGHTKPVYMEHFENFRSRWIESRNGRISRYNDNIITFTEDSAEVHYQIKISRIKEGLRIIGSLAEISEITEVYKLLRYMEDSSWYDYLTGLYNRNAFIKMAPEFCCEENMPLLVVVGDVNGLKAVNDEKGHLAGDRLLQALAGILSQCAPKGTFLSRIGGDEFILLIPGANEDSGQDLISRINLRCAQLNADLFGNPRISFGFASVENSEKTLLEAVEEADLKMYDNKRGSTGGSGRHFSSF